MSVCGGILRWSGFEDRNFNYTFELQILMVMHDKQSIGSLFKRSTLDSVWHLNHYPMGFLWISI